MSSTDPAIRMAEMRSELRAHLIDLIEHAEEPLDQPPRQYVEWARDGFEMFFSMDEVPWAALATRAHELRAEDLRAEEEAARP